MDPVRSRPPRCRAMPTRSLPLPVLLAALLPLATALPAQMSPPPSHLEYVQVASGPRANPTPIEVVVWQDFVSLPQGIPWLRLHYRKATLDQGSYLRVVALRDGEVMTQHQEHVLQWNSTSAYFNGNAVLVQLVAGPHTAGNEVEITEVLAGDPAPDVLPETICGSTDDRVPSSDPRAGRLSNGCTGWIIESSGGGTEKLHLSAGHCYSASGVLQFAVPASNANCSLVQPPVSKQFAVDSASSLYVNGGVGNDYWVYRCFPNSTTGLTSFQEQGAAFTLATTMPAINATVRNTGYGVDGTNTNNAPASSSCSCSSSAGTGTRTQTQQTNTGPLVGNSGTTIRHQADTCGGNSGSPLIDEASGLAIGIHTHGGCSTTAGSSNAGTQVTHPGLQAAIASLCPTCAAHTAYGTSCASARTFYELFAASASDLGGRTLVATRNAAGGYDVAVGPLTTFRTPTGTGLALTDDSISAAQTLPFTFQFPGGSTSSIRVDSNGRIHLAGTGSWDNTPTAGELVGSATPLLAATWCDLNPDGATNTRNVFCHSPVAGEYCITWNNVRFYGVAGAVTMQIALLDNGTNDRFELRWSALTTPNLANLVGFSPGGGAVDPGPRDLTAGPFATGADLPMLM
ncbi:MAG: trypsin-like serine protease, partial [Planctomycetes bacterium]|nr:trypsin-like serine protease [Planctomycetota bacterium]